MIQSQDSLLRAESPLHDGNREACGAERRVEVDRAHYLVFRSKVLDRGDDCGTYLGVVKCYHGRYPDGLPGRDSQLEVRGPVGHVLLVDVKVEAHPVKHHVYCVRVGNVYVDSEPQVAEGDLLDSRADEPELAFLKLGAPEYKAAGQHRRQQRCKEQLLHLYVRQPEAGDGRPGVVCAERCFVVGLCPQAVGSGMRFDHVEDGQACAEVVNSNIGLELYRPAWRDGLILEACRPAAYLLAVGVDYELHVVDYHPDPVRVGNVHLQLELGVGEGFLRALDVGYAEIAVLDSLGPRANAACKKDRCQDCNYG